jgi:hypothetical protein
MVLSMIEIRHTGFADSIDTHASALKLQLPAIRQGER